MAEVEPMTVERLDAIYRHAKDTRGAFVIGPDDEPWQEMRLALEQRERLAEWLDNIREEGHMFGIRNTNIAIQMTAYGLQLMIYNAPNWEPAERGTYYGTILSALAAAYALEKQDG